MSTELSSELSTEYSSEKPAAIATSPASETLSKRLGSLQVFQARIAQRVAQAQLQTQSLNTLLSVQVQGIRVLIPLTEINELLSMPELTPLPLSKRWVSGLAVVRSEVITVFDLAYCLSALFAQFNQNTQNEVLSPNDFMSAASKDAKQSDAKLLLLAKAVANQLAFSVDRVVGTITPDASALQPAPPALSTPFLSLGAYIKGIWQAKRIGNEGENAGDDFDADPVPRELHLELSLAELFKSSAFTQIVY